MKFARDRVKLGTVETKWGLFNFATLKRFINRRGEHFNKTGLFVMTHL